MRYLSQLKLILTLSCDQSTRLCSDSSERELSPAERAALRLHLLSCKGCKRVRHQFGVLRQISERARQMVGRGRNKLPEDARIRIEQRLKEQQP